MSRPDRYSQYLIMDRIQTVISSIDGYYESTDKPTCRSRKSPMAKKMARASQHISNGIMEYYENISLV